MRSASRFAHKGRIMVETNEAPAGDQPSLKRRDLLKAGLAGAVTLTLSPGSILTGQTEQSDSRSLRTNSARIVDIHPHIVSADTQRYPITPLGGQRSDWSKERSVTFEELIADMDEAGVDKAALVHSSTTYGYNCSYVADCVALQPGRFAGVFSVDMFADNAIDKIRYWAVERKLSGLRLFTNGGTDPKQTTTWMSDPGNIPKIVPGLECVQSLGLPVCISLQKPGLPQLLTLVQRFPRIRFIIDHMLEPPISEGMPYAGSQFLFDMGQYDNVYLKLTTNNIRASNTGKGSPETFFPLLVSKFGASRIAWGSNFPASTGTLKDMLQQAEAALAALSEKDREWIFARTAQSLYPVLADK
jgi:L-fuconolactonase